MPWVQHCSATLRRIAFGDGPGARRVHDQRAFAGDQPLVVGGVVPGRRVRRQELRELLVIVERLADGVCLDGDVALGVDQLAPNDWKIAPDVSALSAGCAEADAERKPALWQASAALSMASSVQVSALGGPPAGYIATTSMPACFFIRSMREHGP